jgi:long-chain fatty acid transport protein
MSCTRKSLPAKSVHLTAWIIFAAVITQTCPQLRADGILRNGIGARSMSLGGADVAWAEDSFGAMGNQPAGLGFIHDAQFNLGLTGGILEGQFNKPPTSSGHLDSSLNGLPEAAFAVPLGGLPVTLGGSVIAESLLDAKWKYVDPAGGLGGKTSYGYQSDNSQILNLRSAVGLGGQIGDRLALGASFGVDYNENKLVTPYIFQTAPKVKGAKVLLNLDTSGFGINGQAGLMFRVLTNLQLGVSYESPTRVYSEGNANGNANVQFGAPNLPFHYRAQVRNTFPQTASTGASWGFLPQWRLALQVDWINWSEAFSQLPVALSQGSNPAINAAAGSSSVQDNVPLHWKDEFVYRLGVEYKITPDLALRAGYCYGGNPVPNQTLTPMTAAIDEHTLCAGVGYHWKRCQIDLAYQYSLPLTRNIGSSGLLDGEYSNSSVEVSAHVLALTLGVAF